MIKLRVLLFLPSLRFLPSPSFSKGKGGTIFCKEYNNVRMKGQILCG